MLYKRLKYIKEGIKKIPIFLMRNQDTLITSKYISDNYTFEIKEYEGRFGNNIQQIINGILFAKLTNNSFRSKKHPYIKNIDFNKNHESKIVANNFFYYYAHDFRRDVKIKDNLIYENYPKLARKYIYPNIKFVDDAPLGQDTLVVHLRSGDNFGDREFNKKKNDFMMDTNPKSYFLEIINRFKKTIIVTEGDMKNPLINELKKIFSVEIQSSSLENDFNTLLNAKNLASSGISTFPIAAALCSKNIENFFYSNLINKKHLNPTLLKNSNINLKPIKVENLKKAKEFRSYEAYCDYLISN